MQSLEGVNITPSFVEEELLKHFDKQFFDEIIGVERTKSGWTNYSIKIETTKANYILRIYDPEKPSDEIDFELKIVDYLHSHFPQVPKIFSTKKGKKRFTFLDKYNAILTSFLPGKHYFMNKREEWMSECIAKFLGRMHSSKIQKELLKELLKGQTTRFQMTLDNIIDLLNEYLQKNENAFSNINFKSRMTKYLSIAKESKIQDDIMEKLPKGVVHSDLHDENTLFDYSKKELTGALDWDDTFIGPFVFDIAVMIIFWCFTGKSCKECELIEDDPCPSCQISFRPDWMKKMLHLYEMERGFKLTKEEMECLNYYIILNCFSQISFAIHPQNSFRGNLVENLINMFLKQLEEIIKV